MNTQIDSRAADLIHSNVLSKDWPQECRPRLINSDQNVLSN